MPVKSVYLVLKRTYWPSTLFLTGSILDQIITLLIGAPFSNGPKKVRKKSLTALMKPIQRIDSMLNFEGNEVTHETSLVDITIE